LDYTKFSISSKDSFIAVVTMILLGGHIYAYVNYCSRHLW